MEYVIVAVGGRSVNAYTEQLEVGRFHNSPTTEPTPRARVRKQYSSVVTVGCSVATLTVWIRNAGALCYGES